MPATTTRIPILLILCILLTLLPGCSGLVTPPPPPPIPCRTFYVLQPGLCDGLYLIYRVIDGDTVILHGVGRVRLANVDAPELDTPAGIAARDELIARIGDGPVHVEFVRRKKPSTAGPAGSVVFDRYGRILAKISP